MIGAITTVLCPSPCLSLSSLFVSLSLSLLPYILPSLFPLINSASDWQSLPIKHPTFDRI